MTSTIEPDQRVTYARAMWGLPAVISDEGELTIRLVDTPSDISLCALDIPSTFLAVREIVERGGVTAAVFHAAPPIKSPLGRELSPARVRMIARLTEWPTADEIAELQHLDVEFIHGLNVPVPEPGSPDWIAYSLPRRLPTAAHVTASIRAYALVRRHT